MQSWCGAESRSRFSSSNVVILQTGGVLVELAFVVPVILLIFGGILEFGRFLTEITWASRAGYELTMVQAQSPQGSLTRTKVLSRYSQLRGFLEKDTILDLPENFDYDTSIRVASVSIEAGNSPGSDISLPLSGTLKGILEPINIDIQFRTSGAGLLLGTNADEDLSEFHNINNSDFYNCSGVRTSVAPTSCSCEFQEGSGWVDC